MSICLVFDVFFVYRKKKEKKRKEKKEGRSGGKQIENGQCDTTATCRKP